MTRERWIVKLRTMIGRVEACEAPARIREIHVFGSFARGAIEPNDLDLIVIHDPPSQAVLAPLQEAVKSYSYDELDQEFKAYHRFKAAMRRVFRRGSERMDVKLAASLPEALAQMVKIPREEVRMIWAEDNRNWEANVAAIVPNPVAGRYPRHYFIDVKRTQGTRNDVETITKMIDDQVLDLNRIRLDEVEPRLNPIFHRWLDHWTRIGAMGADGLKILPWAMWWVQEQGAMRPQLWGRVEVGDDARRWHVQVGRLHPYFVYNLFKFEKQMVRQCLIPYRRARGENWMYVFERGPNWGEIREDDLRCES